MNWDEYFYKMAELAKSKSKDKSTKCGSVIVGDGHTVLSIGFNGFPRNVNSDISARHERPAKYLFTEHGERNAIYAAARNGIKLLNSSIHLSGSGLPCADCARAIIQAGIKEVVYRDLPFEGKGDWLKSMEAAKEMLEEAGVKLVPLNENFERIQLPILIGEK
jgi:dCMP deaminase